MLSHQARRHLVGHFSGGAQTNHPKECIGPRDGVLRLDEFEESARSLLRTEFDEELDLALVDREGPTSIDLAALDPSRPRERIEGAPGAHIEPCRSAPTAKGRALPTPRWTARPSAPAPHRVTAT